MDKDLTFFSNTLAIEPAILKKITDQHKNISGIETPKHEVKKNFGGFDYVERSYMARIADVEYPGWSFTILETRSHIVADVEVAFTVHGRLLWLDNGVPRQGDMVASHQNQVLKDKSGYLNVSNTWKSAVTECMKKAFNTYMNIADDVYRNIDTSLTGPERTELLTLLNQVGDDWLEQEQGTTKQEMDDKILSGIINKASFSASKQKIERWVKTYEADIADGWVKDE